VNKELFDALVAVDVALFNKEQQSIGFEEARKTLIDFLRRSPFGRNLSASEQDCFWIGVLVGRRMDAA